MRVTELPTQTELERLFEYEPESGVLTNRITRNYCSIAGSVVGTKMTSKGGRVYLNTKIGGRVFKLHRVIWKLVHGVDPEFLIDHINGNPLDNRLANLRDVDHSTNGFNRNTLVRSSSGVRGVVWNKRQRSWVARHSAVYLGSFKSLLDAVAARYRAERFA